MRIVFMGTPEFAVASLKKLAESGENVVGVITAPDRPAGRGRKVQMSAVKEYALEKDLPVLQPTNLKSDDFQEELKSLNPDLQLVVAFRMLPKKVWQFPAKGTINLHGSLLPQYRGAAPINWAIINGEKETGVTTFFINENIDTGDVILQEKIAIDEMDTAGSLHDKMMEFGAGLLLETVQKIKEENVPKTPQNAFLELKLAPKIFKEHTRINFEKSAAEVYNFVRGLSPYPAATAILEQENSEIPLKIFKVEKEDSVDKKPVGFIEILPKKELKVACAEGWIKVLELQPAGKKRMKIEDFLNGFTLKSGAKML